MIRYSQGHICLCEIILYEYVKISRKFGHVGTLLIHFSFKKKSGAGGKITCRECPRTAWLAGPSMLLRA